MEKNNKNYHVPSYLNEKIDILSDSCLEIAEKLAYKAHGGTYVEELWDAPPSTCLEQVDYDHTWEPLSFTTHLQDSYEMYRTDVSELPLRGKRHHNKEFFGYKSDPAPAPAFKEERPIGVQEKALAAYGKLSALMKENGENTANLDRYFYDMWGVEPSDNLDLVKPQLHLISDRDVLKYSRTRTHRIFGYDNELPLITTDMGHYRPETLSGKRAIDWHKVTLMLRYIGVKLCFEDRLAQDILKDKELKLYYGLVTREFPLVAMSPHFPVYESPGACNTNPTLQEMMRKCMNYYNSERITEQIAQRNQAVLSNIHVNKDLSYNLMEVNALKHTILSTRKEIAISFVEKKPESLDIYNPLKPDNTLPKRISRYKIHYDLSARRAIEIILQMHLKEIYINKGVPKVKAMMRKHEMFDALAISEQEEVISEVASILPRNVGNLVLRLLLLYSANPTTANSKLMKFLGSLVNLENLDFNSGFISAVNQVFVMKECITKLIPMVKKCLFMIGQQLQNPSIPELSKIIMRNPNDAISALIDHNFQRKKMFWTGHYKSRIVEFLALIDSYPPLEKRNRLQLKHMTKLVYYQWITKYLPIVQAQIEDKFHIFPYLQYDRAARIMSKIANSYARKRKIDVIEPKQYPTLMQLARDYDNQLKPPVEFRCAFQMMMDSFRLMTGDVAYMLRKIVLEKFTEEEENEENVEKALKIDKPINEFAPYVVPEDVLNKQTAESSENAPVQKSLVDTPIPSRVTSDNVQKTSKVKAKSLFGKSSIFGKTVVALDSRYKNRINVKMEISDTYREFHDWVYLSRKLGDVDIEACDKSYLTKAQEIVEKYLQSLAEVQGDTKPLGDIL